MASILYHMVDGEPTKVMVEACKVHGYLKKDYCTTADQLLNRDKADTNRTGKLSNEEIKAAAKEAGIRVGNKSIKTLKKELGL